MESFEALFARYFSRVYRFAYSLMQSEAAAEELTQQTFYKALKNIDSFEGRSDPGTWLCSIAKHAYFSCARDRERSYPPDSAVFDRAEPGAEGQVERTEDAMRIHRHLHELEEPYREVFMLRVFGELKYAQIASLFRKTEGWARVTYYRAKQMLCQAMKEEENGEGELRDRAGSHADGD